MRIIGGIYRQRSLAVPKRSKTRPTSGRLRETVFAICGPFVEGAQMLDLFAGSGAMGLEALSRGAKSAFFIEKEREAIDCLRKNIETLGASSQSTLIQGDVISTLNRLGRQETQFSLIYADPPYTKDPSVPGITEKTVLAIDENRLLTSGGVFFLESPSEHLALSEGDLQYLVRKKWRRQGKSVLHEFTSCC